MCWVFEVIFEIKEAEKMSGLEVSVYVFHLALDNVGILNCGSFYENLWMLQFKQKKYPNGQVVQRVHLKLPT